MFFCNILDKSRETDVVCCGTSLMVKLEMRVLHAACTRVKVVVQEMDQNIELIGDSTCCTTSFERLGHISNFSRKHLQRIRV